MGVLCLHHGGGLSYFDSGDAAGAKESVKAEVALLDVAARYFAAGAAMEPGE